MCITLGAAIYALTLYIAYQTYLPAYLVTHFEGLKTFETMYASQMPMLVLYFLPVGWAAYSFLFSPSLGTHRNLGDIASESFNPASATLGETLKWNMWGWDKRTKVLVARTVALVLAAGYQTTIKTWLTIEGAEPWGAAGWAGVWASAALATGAVYGWVGSAGERVEEAEKESLYLE